MRPNAVVGQISNFKMRTVNSISGNNISVSVWNFNVVRYDSHGNQEHPMMPVEMRGWRLSRILNDGEWVSVPGKWQRGRIRHVKRVHNLTTDTTARKDRAVLLIPTHPVSAVATASTRGMRTAQAFGVIPSFLPMHNRVNKHHWSVSLDVQLSLVSNPTGRDHGEWKRWS
jgi:hypothetical protein